MNSIKVVLCLGSNSGDRYDALTKAIDWLNAILEDTVSSPIYETPPYSGSGALYLNAVVSGSCNLNGGVDELEKRCKAYEISEGRDEKARKENRVPIDIDIVIADKKILRPSDYGRNFFRIGFSRINK